MNNLSAGDDPNHNSGKVSFYITALESGLFYRIDRKYLNI